MATCPACRSHYDDAVERCVKDGETLLPDQAFAAEDADLAAGTIVGEYQIEGKLGEGGFGIVYKAVHPLIGKRCAIKTLHRSLSSNPQMVSRFIAEARAVNQVRHKNIIDIFSFGALPDGRQYFVMELLDGMPLDKYLDQQGPLPLERALPILRPVARALDAAHAAGIAHRDLKPENIFLTFDDEGVPIPKLLDFGIAKLLSPDGAAHKTRTGAPMGTPHYMSPEQCRGANVDHRTDIYAYGVLCYITLSGRVPFDGQTVMDVLMQHVNQPPPSIRALIPQLPAAIDAAILHMLAKQAEQRPQTLAAAFDEMNDAARAAGVAVRPNAVVTARSGGVSVVTGDPAIARSLQASTGPTMKISEASPPSVAAASVPPPKTGTPGATFTPAERDVAAPRKSNAPVIVGASLAVVAVAALAIGFVAMRGAHVPKVDGTRTTTARAAEPLGAVVPVPPAVTATAAVPATAAPIAAVPASAEPEAKASAAPSAAPSASAVQKPPTTGHPHGPPANPSVNKDLEQAFP